jgi:hypothetical protein
MRAMLFQLVGFRITQGVSDDPNPLGMSILRDKRIFLKVYLCQHILFQSSGDFARRLKRMSCVDQHHPLNPACILCQGHVIKELK